MKSYNKPSASELVAAFDNQLKNMLMEDLKVLRAKYKFTSGNKQAIVQQNLTAA